MNTPLLIALLAGWLLDLCLGDPARLPHPIVWFGRAIAVCEHRFNHGRHRRLRGAIVAIGLITATFLLAALLSSALGSPVIPRWGTPLLAILWNALTVFYCLAGTTLIREVRAVFLALDRSLDEGRQQVARIVGRDTSTLSAQEVRTAALETLAENLNDGVVAPLFWFALLGAPGMWAYKMVNTLDSMIGYRTDRYRAFGCVAARIDDAAGFLPARLTSLLMLLGFKLMTLLGHQTSSPRNLIAFVRRYGRAHASPNSGYPEAALAAILDCRFGGPHYYFGQLFPKPYIGQNDRPLTTADMHIAVRINRIAEVLMLLITAAALWMGS